MSLKEMMDLKELPESLKKYVSDYPIHLVNVREIEDTSVFKTDLKQVVDFLKCAENKEKESGDMCKALQDWAAEEREIGMQEGVEKGMEKGIADGMLRAKREAILNMLELGISKERILTKYTEEEYESAVVSR